MKKRILETLIAAGWTVTECRRYWRHYQDCGDSSGVYLVSKAPVAHTSNPEFEKLGYDRAMEALRDRTVRVAINVQPTNYLVFHPERYDEEDSYFILGDQSSEIGRFLRDNLHEAHLNKQFNNTAPTG